MLYYRDTPSLPVHGPIPQNRKWRTSYQVPFAAMMTWEKFSCTSSYVQLRLSRTSMLCSHNGRRFKGPQIRLVLNEAPLPLTTCKNVDKKLGSCSLADFVSVYAPVTNITWGSAAWNASCGPATL
jgi:acid phosphatase